MNNKRRGIEKERQAKKELEDLGYNTVRSRGSFGLFDIIAIRQDTIRLIQIKRVKGKYYSFKNEIADIKAFRNHPRNCQKELWIWLDRLKGRVAGWHITVIR